MESSYQSQNCDDGPKNTRETLEPEVSRARGNLSPELAWLELTLKVAQAQDRDAEAQQVLESSEYKGDLDDLVVLMSKFSPDEGIALFHEANPNFDLQNILRSADSMVVLQAVLNTVELDRNQ